MRSRGKQVCLHTGGRDQMIIFEINAIQLILEISDWNERQLVAKNGKLD